ncbi:MAG: AsmA family protein [Pseudomonadota bacterium]
MKTVFKVIAGLILVVLLVIGASSIFVRYYLSGEKIEEMLLPRARQALGRDVTIGAIDVSLFRGIEVSDFTVKEVDGKEDFASIGTFALRYDFMPLLRKKLVVTDISLDKPALRIHRDKNGNYNFETLAMLVQKEKDEHPEKTEATVPPSALPIALTMDRISIRDARFVFADDMGELPAVEAVADVNIGMDLSRGLLALRFKGDGRYELKARYQGVEPQLTGTMDFDQKRIAINCDVAMQEEKATISAVIENYLQTPDVEVNLASSQLNVDNLLGLAALLGEKEEKGKRENAGGGTVSSPGNGPKSPPPVIGDKIPAGLIAHGRVDIAKAYYQGLEMADLHLTYRLEKNIFTVNEFSAKTAEGTVTSTLVADFNHPGPSYEGELDVKDIQITKVQQVLFPKIREKLFGSLTTNLTYSGSGIQWPVLREQLNGTGDFRLADGRIENSPIFHSIADTLGLNELRNLDFKDYSGNLRISEGDVLLTSSMDGRDVDMQANGRIGLDAVLDLPLAITLSPEMSEKVAQKTSLVKYLADDQGQTRINLKMTGTLQKPKATFDSRAIEKKVIEDVGRGLLKGLFGQ